MQPLVNLLEKRKALGMSRLSGCCAFSLSRFSVPGYCFKHFLNIIGFRDSSSTLSSYQKKTGKSNLVSVILNLSIYAVFGMANWPQQKISNYEDKFHELLIGIEDDVFLNATDCGVIKILVGKS